MVTKTIRRPHVGLGWQMAPPPRWVRAAPGIGSGVYFRVYGKRLEPHTLRTADNTPHPLRKWGRRAAGGGA